MNKKASGTMIFFGMMLGVMIWIAFTQMLSPVKDAVITARSPSQLDCSNTSITIGNKGTCVIVDWMMFGWAGAVISAILGAAGGRLFSTVLQSRK